ncbi:hypothetical protein MMC10_009390 [Thelotrema lepadinum]|nr:hypothetical protein [Thelotrema lepadinum]
MTDRSANGSGGVRNMRALFEAKNEQQSPPSRGRSPAASSESVRSTSSRPISKVRASFVTVEKSGSFGPMLGLRKTSDAVDPASSTGKIEGEGVESQSQNTEQTSGSAATPVKMQENLKEHKPEEVQLANGKQSEAAAVKAPAESVQVDGSKDDKTQIPDQPKPEKSKAGTKASSGLQTTTSKVLGSSVVKSRPAPIGTTKGAPPGKSSAGKSPASASSSAAAAKKSAPNTTQPKLSRKDSTIKPKAGPVASSKISSPKTAVPKTSTAKKAVKETFPAVKPKSPTKPVKPRTSDGDFFSRMMKPTASSASKTQEGQSSTSSGKASAEHSATRTSTKRPSDANGDFLSRMMRPTASSASKTNESDAKNTKASFKKGSRASTTPAEGGFMARMMKPTASSASKTHEKVPPLSSPPRKTEDTKPKRKSDGPAVKQVLNKEEQSEQPEQDPPLKISASSETKSVPTAGASKGDGSSKVDSGKSAIKSLKESVAPSKNAPESVAEMPKAAEPTKTPSANGLPSTPKKDAKAPVKTPEPSVGLPEKDEAATTKVPAHKPEQPKAVEPKPAPAPKTPTKVSQPDTSTKVSNISSSSPKQSKPLESATEPSQPEAPATNTHISSSPHKQEATIPTPKTPSKESPPKETSAPSSVSQATPAEAPSTSAKNQTPAFDATAPAKDSASSPNLPSEPLQPKLEEPFTKQTSDSPKGPTSVPEKPTAEHSPPTTTTSKPDPLPKPKAPEEETNSEDGVAGPGGKKGPVSESLEGSEKPGEGGASDPARGLYKFQYETEHFSMSNMFHPQKFGDDEDETY